MTELLKCPFCDSPAKLDTIFDPYVKCMKCGSTGPMCSEPDAAIEAWNRRAASQDLSSDNGECYSCVESKCVTGKSCVSLGLDSCKHCKNTGYLQDGNHCQWCSDVIIDEPDFISDHDAKGLEIIAGWLDKDGLAEAASMLRRLAQRQQEQS